MSLSLFTLFVGCSICFVFMKFYFFHRVPPKSTTVICIIVVLSRNEVGKLTCGVGYLFEVGWVTAECTKMLRTSREEDGQGLWGGGSLSPRSPGFEKVHTPWLYRRLCILNSYAYCVFSTLKPPVSDSVTLLPCFNLRGWEPHRSGLSWGHGIPPDQTRRPSSSPQRVLRREVHVWRSQGGFSPDPVEGCKILSLLCLLSNSCASGTKLLNLDVEIWIELFEKITHSELYSIHLMIAFSLSRRIYMVQRWREEELISKEHVEGQLNYHLQVWFTSWSIRADQYNTDRQHFI